MPAPDPAQVKERLRVRAHELGFHAFGVAPAGPLAEAWAAARRWLAAGHHADMTYLERTQAKLASAAELLPGARSVICLLVDYRADTATTPPRPGPEAGRVARYARARDYHVALAKRLQRLGRTLVELAPGSRYTPSVDSKPLLERAYAWRAGLGFLARNSMLITPGIGSWTLLCELVTDFGLPADEPVEGTCGRCTRCLDACPTGAIVEPGTVDARRCISYWTIEHEGPLPAGARLHGWTFGCDACQEVCPYNHPEPGPGPARTLGADFATPRAAGAWLEPATLEALAAPAAFEARFGGTPLMRAGAESLARNLARVRDEGGS